MLIKCQKCGHENQLGNIFCRNCGEKLDIETSRPEVSNKKAGNNVMAIVKRVATLLVLLAVIYVIYAAFVPSGSADLPTLTDDQKTAVDKKLESMMKRAQGKLSEGDKFTFTADDACYALNKLTAVDCPVTLRTAGQSVSFAATIKMFGQVPVRYTVVGYPANPEDPSSGSVSLSIGSAEVGQLNVLPLFGLGDLVVEKFKPVYAHEKVKGLLSEMAKIEVDENSAIILLFKEKKKRKEVTHRQGSPDTRLLFESPMPLKPHRQASAAF